MKLIVFEYGRWVKAQQMRPTPVRVVDWKRNTGHLDIIQSIRGSQQNYIYLVLPVKYLMQYV